MSSFLWSAQMQQSLRRTLFTFTFLQLLTQMTFDLCLVSFMRINRPTLFLWFINQVESHCCYSGSAQCKHTLTVTKEVGQCSEEPAT